MQRVYKDLIRNFPKEGENIEDKKVDDKPMVIHTKEKAKIHSHEPKGARIKGSNIYTVERGSKIAGAKAAETTGKKSYRKSTAYQENVKEKGLSRFKRIVRESMPKKLENGIRNPSVNLLKRLADWYDG